MRRRMASVLTVGAALAAATALATTTAAAAQQSITVTNPNADGSYTAHSDFVTLSDVTSGIAFDCESTDTVNASNSSGTISSSSYTTPADVGDINVDFNNCNGPLGPVTATPADQPYDLVVTSYDAGAGAAGQGSGYIGPVNVHVSMSGCNFDVVGNAPGLYDNATHTISVGGALPAGVAPLEPVNIVGCFGLVSPGDELTYEGDYLVDPAITISSP